MAIVKSHSANQLNIVVDHFPVQRLLADHGGTSAHATSAILDYGKRLGKKLLQSFSLLKTLHELRGFGAKFVIGKILVLYFQGVDFLNYRNAPLDILAVTTSLEAT